MKTMIRHCKHINPITNKRLDSCPVWYPHRKGGMHRTPTEEVVKDYCIPMKEMSSCFYYED